MPVEYYDKILYPLQNKVFEIFKGSPFYLTGGTALSRGYFNHRYSDDLDYFVNHNPDFHRIAALHIDAVLKVFTNVEVDYKGEYLYRIFVSDEKLKIELVNDVPSHVGRLFNHPVLGIIDSKENILANKLTAIVDRTLPKDMVDIYFLLRGGLSLKQALLDANNKAAGIAPLLIAKIFAEFDYEILNEEVKWITPISSSDIKHYLTDIAVATVKGII